MRDMLPKLFFVHFCETSFIAEIDQKIIGFLIGFLSQSHSEEAYIHFVGIHPDCRKQGVGSALYQQFFQVVQRFDRVRVRCELPRLIKTRSLIIYAWDLKLNLVMLREMECLSIQITMAQEKIGFYLSSNYQKLIGW